MIDSTCMSGAFGKGVTGCLPQSVVADSKLMQSTSKNTGGPANRASTAAHATISASRHHHACQHVKSSELHRDARAITVRLAVQIAQDRREGNHRNLFGGMLIKELLATLWDLDSFRPALVVSADFIRQPGARYLQFRFHHSDHS